MPTVFGESIEIIVIILRILGRIANNVRNHPEEEENMFSGWILRLWLKMKRWERGRVKNSIKNIITETNEKSLSTTLPQVISEFNDRKLWNVCVSRVFVGWIPLL